MASQTAIGGSILFRRHLSEPSDRRTHSFSF